MAVGLAAALRDVTTPLSPTAATAPLRNAKYNASVEVARTPGRDSLDATVTTGNVAKQRASLDTTTIKKQSMNWTRSL